MTRGITAVTGDLSARLALVLALVGAVVFLFGPVRGRFFREPVTTDDAGQALSRSTTVIEELGAPRAMALAGFPVAVAAIPVFGRRTPVVRGLRILAAIVLVAFVALALPTGGLFFAPSALAMVFAALARPPGYGASRSRSRR